MKIMSYEEKKEIIKDWKSLLPDYKLHNSWHFMKRNGPVLTAVYLHHGRTITDYMPQFHTHLLIDPFPCITLNTVLYFRTPKGTKDFFSYRRHHNEFDKISAEFKKQIPEAFLQTMSCKTMTCLFEKTMPDTMGYMDIGMEDHVLLLYWCRHEVLAEEKIKEYKNIIKSWDDSYKVRIKDENNWEQNLRKKMHMDTLRKNLEDEIVKHKLTKYKDYGFLCD